MATTYKGRRTRFDNIAIGSAAGVENPAVGLAGVSPGFANGERLRTATTGDPSTSGREFFWRTVSGGAVTDITTDLGH
jgi:hypothetical protein